MQKFAIYQTNKISNAASHSLIYCQYLHRIWATYCCMLHRGAKPSKAVLRVFSDENATAKPVSTVKGNAAPAVHNVSKGEPAAPKRKALTTITNFRKEPAKASEQKPIK